MASRVDQRNGASLKEGPHDQHIPGPVPGGGSDRLHLGLDQPGEGGCGEGAATSHAPSLLHQDKPGAAGHVVDLQQRASQLKNLIVPPRGEWADYHPAAWQGICPTKDVKKRIIEGWSFTFGASGDSYAIFFRWPLPGLQTTIILQDPLLVWDVINKTLTGELGASWKPMRKQPRHLSDS